MTSRTAAIVPMRHSSERVPGKNYRPLAGRPLYHHIIQSLLATPSIDEVVIDTDSAFIKQDAAEHFPSVRVLERPKHLRDGAIAMNDVLLNTLEHIDAQIVLQTHSTSPFLKSSTLDTALRDFAQSLGSGSCDSMFSVTRLQVRLWDENVRPVNHNPNVLLRTQDLAPLFEENSSFFIFTPPVLRQLGRRIGDNPKLVETSRIESLDIDTETDFLLAEAVANMSGVLQ